MSTTERFGTYIDDIVNWSGRIWLVTGIDNWPFLDLQRVTIDTGSVVGHDEHTRAHRDAVVWHGLTLDRPPADERPGSSPPAGPLP